MDTPYLLRNLPTQFDPLRPSLESSLQPYVKIHLGEAVEWLDSAWNGDPLEPWQSKIGGYPYLPKGTDYPTDRETGEMMMFLMQVNCADLPIIDGLTLPRQGILQFYSGLDVSMDKLSPEQHRILYFPEIFQDRSNLISDFSFLKEVAFKQEWCEQIYPLTFSAQQDVFCVTRDGYAKTFDVPEELKTLCREFRDWLDEEDNQKKIDLRMDKLNEEVKEIINSIRVVKLQEQLSFRVSYRFVNIGVNLYFSTELIHA